MVACCRPGSVREAAQLASLHRGGSGGGGSSSSGPRGLMPEEDFPGLANRSAKAGAEFPALGAPPGSCPAACPPLGGGSAVLLANAVAARGADPAYLSCIYLGLLLPSL